MDGIRLSVVLFRKEAFHADSADGSNPEGIALRAAQQQGRRATRLHVPVVEFRREPLPPSRARVTWPARRCYGTAWRSFSGPSSWAKRRIAKCDDLAAEISRRLRGSGCREDGIPSVARNRCGRAARVCVGRSGREALTCVASAARAPSPLRQGSFIHRLSCLKRDPKHIKRRSTSMGSYQRHVLSVVISY